MAIGNPTSVLQEKGSGTNLTTFTTSGTFTPVAGRYYQVTVALVNAGDTCMSADPALTDTNGLTWAVYRRQTQTNAGRGHVVFHCLVPAGSYAASALTYTRASTDDFDTWTIIGVEFATGVLQTSTAAAVVAANTDGSAATNDPMTDTYPQARTAGNMLVAWFVRFSGAVASTADRAGWTELLDYNAGATESIAMHYRATDDTIASADYTGTDTGNKSVILAEVVAAAVSSGSAGNQRGAQRGVLRGVLRGTV